MQVINPPIEIFLDYEERNTLKKAYSIINEIYSKVEDCCMLSDREVSHEELEELLHTLKLVL